MRRTNAEIQQIQNEMGINSPKYANIEQQRNLTERLSTASDDTILFFINTIPNYIVSITGFIHEIGEIYEKKRILLSEQRASYMEKVHEIQLLALELKEKHIKELEKYLENDSLTDAVKIQIIKEIGSAINELHPDYEAYLKEQDPLSWKEWMEEYARQHPIKANTLGVVAVLVTVTGAIHLGKKYRLGNKLKNALKPIFRKR